MREAPMREEVPLTPRQRSLFEYLRRREARGERPPTLDELCAALGLRSRGSLHKHVRALVDAGLVEPLAGRHRGVRLRHERRAHLPLAGRIAAGQPFEPFENADEIEVPERLRGRGPCYVLQVKGDSMIDAGILDGDWVIVERREHARDHEVVVALVDGSETTLKRIVQRPGEVILYPANGRYEPLRYAPDRVRIQGVLVGQMRSYR